MRRILTICILAIAGVLAASLAAMGSSHSDSPKTVRVIEHGTTDLVVDIGPAGDSSGDLITFHNQVFNPADTAVVGHDQGQCVRISPADGSWECTWITFVPGGAITVEGPFFDTRDSTLAITGGEGIYSNARGTMRLTSLAGGTKYIFDFRLDH